MFIIDVGGQCIIPNRVIGTDCRFEVVCVVIHQIFRYRGVTFPSLDDQTSYDHLTWISIF